MPKFLTLNSLDAALNYIKNNADYQHLVKGYSLGDSYATVVANSVASVAMASGDFTLGDQGTNGRQLAVAAKNDVATTAASQQYDQGTAESGGASTLTDTDKTWTVNEHAGRAVKIISGTGAGQVRRIGSNTSNALTVTETWTTQPDATSQYQILDDLHLVVVASGSTEVLAATDESSNQVIAYPGTVNMPTYNIKQNQPV